MSLFLVPALVFASAIGQVGKVSTQGTLNRTVPAAPGKQTQVTLDHIGLVTGSYLRQHYPNALIALAALVKSGKVPATALSHLASPTVTQALMAAGPTSPVKANLTKSTPSVTRGPSPWATTMSMHNIALNQVDFSPSTLVFPPSWDKQTVTTTLHVTSLTDGPVTAALGPTSPFAIKSMVIYDGTLTPAGGGRMVRHIAAQTTHAPWSIEANAGQDVDITLSFSPHFDLFSFTAGLYKDQLTVGGKYWNSSDPKEKPWLIKVPVSGFFNGLALDVIALADEWHPELITDAAYDPRVPQVLPLGFHLINTNAAVTGTLSGDGLPAGVTCQPVTVTIGQGQTQAVTLNLSIDRSGSFYLNAPRETPIPLNFKFVHGAKTVPVHLDLTIFEGINTWYVHGSCNLVDFTGTLTLTAAGGFSFAATGFNGDPILPVTCSMQGGFQGYQSIVNLGFNISPYTTGFDSYGFNSPAVASNFLVWINMPFRLNVNVTTH